MDNLAKVYSRALIGLNAPQVEVEAHLSNGLPQFHIVGLAEAEVKESRDRVRAAILHSGFNFPVKKIVINLAPADLPKNSSRFDLPIAVSILAADGQINAELRNYEFAGELALSGLLRPARGTLLIMQAAAKAGHRLILPAASQSLRALLPQSRHLFAASLTAVAAHLNGITDLADTLTPPAAIIPSELNLPDLNEVIGQHTAKKALEIAAAGGHSLLLIGPPGTGKSMLAARLPGILPPLTPAERLENATIYSLNAAELDYTQLARRPFRSPHHSASAVAIVGGGTNPKPGEITLAHNGILFLDELPEFDRRVLEVLREPLETHKIHISRAAGQVTYPADFQLIAAMNPCPCGFYGHPTQECRCTPEQIKRYQHKLSGPLLDRLDLMIEVPNIPLTELKAGHQDPEASSVVRQRVEAARQRQRQRTGKLNAALTPGELQHKSLITPEAERFLIAGLEKLRLSARGFHKILRVARTIADLETAAAVLPEHVIQAISFRRTGIL